MKLLLCALVLGLVGCASTKSSKDGGAKSVKKEVEVEVEKKEMTKKSSEKRKDF